MKEWEDMTFAEKLSIKKASQRSFLNFTRLWFELIQGDKLLVNWHHRMIAQQVDKVLRGQESSQNLAIAIPPGGTKTEFMSIHLPAYTNMLVQTDEIKRFRNLNLSFADSLVKRNSRRTKDIIGSKEYQEFWPCNFGVNQAEEWEIIDERGKVKGSTVSRAMGGQITGGRGGYYGEGFSGAISLDDPQKPSDMFSEVKRDESNRKLTNTVRSRRGDKSKDHPTPFFVIQQRLHQFDTIGFCLSGGMGVDFKLIKIPALISEDFLATLPPETAADCWKSIKDSDSRVIAGVRYWSYWPEMEHIDQLVDLWEKDEYTFMSQYMQDPQSLSGGMIDAGWFKRYTQLPELKWRGVYVDTAQKKGERNDYTVFEYWGLGVDNNAYLIDLVRGKFDADELLQTAQRCWNNWVPWNYAAYAAMRYMKIEDKSSGTGLIQQLTNQNHIPVDPVPRGTDKTTRCLDIQHFIKTGRVFIPDTYDDDGNRLEYVYNHEGDVVGSTEWVISFLAEAADFSADDSHKNDDMLDPMFDALSDMLGNQVIDLADID